MTPLAERTLFHAVAALGVHEDEGPNKGKWVDEYLKFVGLPPGNPWCAAAVCLWAHKAAEDLDLEVELPKIGSTSQLLLWFKDRKLLIPKPRTGAVCMVRGGPTGHHHTCLVERLIAPYAHTVDGNDGDAVRRDVHDLALCDFARWPK